jgi:hypothetical protein
MERYGIRMLSKNDTHLVSESHHCQVLASLKSAAASRAVRVAISLGV